MNITEKAMLVRFSCSQWTARKYDKKISEKVASDFHTKNDAGRYNKVLIAQEAIKSIQSAASEARQFHYDQTLPWEDDGYRILPAANFMGYSSKMRNLKAKFNSEVDAFLSNYGSFVEDAKIRLNGMFRQADYPSIADLERKYSFDTSISPVPDSSDFRVSLQDSEVDKIKESISARMELAQQKAMQDIWSRLHKVVECMVERLSKKDAVFRDTLIGNAQELVDLLPKLNLTEDPELEKMRRNVEEKLCVYAPDELRENPEIRKAAAEDASGILEAMSAYMGAQTTASVEACL